MDSAGLIRTIHSCSLHSVAAATQTKNVLLDETQGYR